MVLLSTRASPRRAVRCVLLPRHRNLEALLRRDQVIVIILPQVELDPVDGAAETVAARAVVRRDGGAFVPADVAGFVAGEDHRYGHLQAAFTVFLAVHIERDVAALGQAAAVVLELQTHLVCAGGDRLAPSTNVSFMPRRL